MSAAECLGCGFRGELRFGVMDFANNAHVAVCSLECVVTVAVDAIGECAAQEARDIDRARYADWRRNNTGWAALLPGRIKHPPGLDPDREASV